ncbi:MAG: hypothetical protein CVU63_01925 [Deltaproteobacteria bacterium HGW-Deltaproteobacteria-20]|nr:MAG: hypothetical protein CVU63_01925 [Deltaproteobacteria bacterium HGW-Deltaproteobacteria-20]
MPNDAILVFGETLGGIVSDARGVLSESAGAAVRTSWVDDGWCSGLRQETRPPASNSMRAGQRIGRL